MPSTASAPVERLGRAASRPGRPSGAPRSRAPSGGTRSARRVSVRPGPARGVGIGRRRASPPDAAALCSSQSGSPVGSSGISRSIDLGDNGSRVRTTPLDHRCAVPVCRTSFATSHSGHDGIFARRDPIARAASASTRACVGDDREVLGVVHRVAAYEKSVCGSSGSTRSDELGAVVVRAVHHRAHRPELDELVRRGARAASSSASAIVDAPDRASVSHASSGRITGMRSWTGAIVAFARVVTIAHDSSHGALGLVVVLPDLPQPGERDRLAVAPVDEHRLLLLAARHRLPLVEPVGREDAAALAERGLERRLLGHGLGPGVDQAVPDLRVVRPRRHESPAHLLEHPGRARRLGVRRRPSLRCTIVRTSVRGATL